MDVRGEWGEIVASCLRVKSEKGME
ncbi:hypothetical protein A2U01_0077506, partial [Trifolium medium]|nr:hypothetical protein [Trifolium medium]